MYKGNGYKVKIMWNDAYVAIVDAKTFKYPETCFRPSIDYPELRQLGFGISKEDNQVYDAVRESFYLLGLDKENYGHEKWNPLGKIISPGDNVLIKPNLVMDHNLYSEGGTKCLYTQPSVVAPIIDYAILALKGKGNITIGDAPMQECQFDVIRKSGFNELIEFYSLKGINVQFVDFRELTSVIVDGIHHNSINENVRGKVVDLSNESEFWGVEEKTLNKMRVTNYDPRILTSHHNNRKQEYYVSDYVLSADVIINMPKPKSHRKAGATMALKNLVGINTRKEYLPHHTMGSKDTGGDEFEKRSNIHLFRSKLWDSLNIASATGHYKKAIVIRQLIRFLSLLLKVERTPYAEGSWWGNDTISKTIVDLNKIVFYSNKKGTICSRKQRKMLIVGDMIVSGEKEGPVAPSPKEVGLIAAATNPVCFDEIVATVMGFDYRKMPSVFRARNVSGVLELVSKEIKPVIKSNIDELNDKTVDTVPHNKLLYFEPTSGWKNYIEL